MLFRSKGVDYTEGRLLPYFFPDVFCEGGDPIGEARDNWRKARRALLRSPLDRIGYGGYLKLASNWPGFIDEIQNVVTQFRESHEKYAGDSFLCGTFQGGDPELLGQSEKVDVQSGTSCDLAQRNLFRRGSTGMLKRNAF